MPLPAVLCNRATALRGGPPVAWLPSCSRGRVSPVGNCGTPEQRNHRRPPAVPVFRCCKRVRGCAAWLCQLGALGQSRTQLQKYCRFWNAFSDLNRGRGSFSSPLHPYPLAAGSHPHGGSSTRPDLPSIQIFAATPLQGRDQKRGEMLSVGGSGYLWPAPFCLPRPVNVRFGDDVRPKKRGRKTSKLLI